MQQIFYENGIYMIWAYSEATNRFFKENIEEENQFERKWRLQKMEEDQKNI